MSGDPGFIIFIGIFGLPPLVLWIVGCIQMVSGGFNPPFTTLSLSQKFTAFICLMLVMVFSSGCLWFVSVFAHELNIQLSCAGATCAKTGLFFFMYLPVPWISFLLAWATASQFVEDKSLPLRRKPDFSLNRDI